MEKALRQTKLMNGSGGRRSGPQETLVNCPVPEIFFGGPRGGLAALADSGPLSAKLLKNGTLKAYKGFPHGMPTTEAETINADLLAFIKG
jgi:non-heme chloroperoxidase